MEKNKIRDDVVEEVSSRLANLITELTDEVYGKLIDNMPIALGEDEKVFIKKMVLDNVASEVLRQLRERMVE
jgi:hypothetical protein